MEISYHLAENICQILQVCLSFSIKGASRDLFRWILPYILKCCPSYLNAIYSVQSLSRVWSWVNEEKIQNTYKTGVCLYLHISRQYRSRRYSTTMHDKCHCFYTLLQRFSLDTTDWVQSLESDVSCLLMGVDVCISLWLFVLSQEKMGNYLRLLHPF